MEVIPSNLWSVAGASLRAVAFLVLIGLASPASGLAPPPAAEARTALRHAADAFSRRAYSKAIAYLKVAERLAPSWQTARGLAVAYRETERWLLCWEWSQRALARQISAAHRAIVEKAASDASTELLRTHARLVLVVDPPDATVLRDGAPWETSPRDRWTTRPASLLRVSRIGYSARSERWVHPVGRVHRHTITLSRKQTASDGAVRPGVNAPTAAKPYSTSTDASTGWKKPVGWVGVGVGGTATIIATVLYIIADADIRGIDPASADLSDRQAAQGKRIAGDVLIGVGGAVLATGIVLLVLDALDASEAPASQQTTLSPLFLPGGAGVRAQITF